MATRPRTRLGSRRARSGADGAARAPGRAGGWDRRAAACLLLATGALVVALAVALSHTAPRRTGGDGVKLDRTIGSIPGGSRICQGGERIPRGTAALGITIASASGPTLRISLLQGGRLLQQASQGAGWAGAGLLVPISPPPHDLEGVDVCIDVLDAQPLTLLGGFTPPHVGSLSGAPGSSLRIDDFRPGAESWWSYLPLVAQRLGLGRGAWGGTWVAWLLAALALAAWGIAALILLRTVVADRPLRTGRLLVLVGCLNAIVWSLVTPPFQALDEDTHYAYVQQLAAHGRPPVERGRPRFSPALRTLMADTHGGALHLGTDRIAIWSNVEEVRLERDMAAPLSDRGNGDAGPANPEPPLYYALAAVPYKLAIGASPLLRFQLVRLASALLAGVTAVLVYLFARECLPRQRWAWSVGGLAAAFVPMLGAMSAAVNPDALLYAVCAALFLCLARAFRRGLSTRLAVWTGVVLAIGLVGKINFYGLVPGAVVAIALAARRSEGAWNGRALRLAALPLAIGLAPYALMSGLDALAWDRPAILARSASSTHRHFRGLGDQLAFLWQFYLPRLPWQPRLFPLSVGYDLTFKTFVGEFGRLAVRYPDWAYEAALGAFALLGAGALRALVAGRGALRRRRAELLGYLLMAAGLLALIDLVAFRRWSPTLPGAAQGRYLLPLLAPFAVVVALAARGAGARWGRAAGVAIVVAAIAWSLFGQLLTVAYYYG